MFDLNAFLGNAAALPDSVLNSMLHAAADVIVKEQKATAKEMLVGQYYTGDLVKSITKTRVYKAKNGNYIRIIFKGSRKRGNTTTKNAEIAYINEYGKKGQSPRPFIRTANEKCSDEALDAAGKVFDDFLDSL